MKIHLVGDELFHTDVRTDMAKEFCKRAHKSMIIYREEFCEIESHSVFMAVKFRKVR